MADLTLLVLANPKEPHLRMLDELRGRARVVVGDDIEALAKDAPAADALFVWFGRRRLLEQVFAVAERVRWVHSFAAGLDNLLFPALVGSPVLLTNARGVFSQSLGEFAVAAALFFAKDFRRMIRSQNEGVWDPFDVEEVSRQTMGILGYGDIGRAVARRAKALGMRVLALRRRPEKSAGDPLADEVFGPENMRGLLSRSDYVVVASPLTEDTLGLVGDAELAAMKKSAVIINVGRGPVIDEAALVRALSTGSIRGAALDVFNEEPLPAGHPLFRLENVLLSPHCADHTATWLEEAFRFFLDNFERFRKGEPLRNIVDKRLGY